MMNLRDNLMAHRNAFICEMGIADTPEKVEAVRVKYFGRHGLVKDLHKAFSQATPDDKRKYGPDFEDAMYVMNHFLEIKQNGNLLQPKVVE